MAIDPSTLANWVTDARARTLAIVEDLSDAQLCGERLAIVNPLLWEIGHVAWFQEKWVLRHAAGHPPLRPDGDTLYDSSAVPHDTRWDLPLPSRPETLSYLGKVRDLVLERLAGSISEKDVYFVLLSVFHEDMHNEAFATFRQTLGYPPPPGLLGAATDAACGELSGDVEIPGGTFRLGVEPGTGFVFDNEKWAHPVAVAPFSLARAPTTQKEFAAFVEEDGYARPDLWSEAGWCWRRSSGATHPIYWRRSPQGFERRVFDTWVPLEPHLPVLHVNWYEAEAYCRFVKRRLPTELEWEVAAAAEPAPAGLSSRKRRYPWGDDFPGARQAHLDGHRDRCVDVAAHPEGDSAFGCRHMLGNVWQWTASPFLPYPGFVADPYKEYSEPYFHSHKVLRGGCFLTRGRLLRNTWRNFYAPDRRDIWAGFRTCA